MEAVLPVARPDLGSEELEAIAGVLEEGWLGRGELTERFESELSSRVDGMLVVAVSTGTAALQLALEAIGVGGGDEVIVPSLTYCATYQAVAATGALPVFADIDERTLSLDPEDAAGRVSSRTRAILTVHFAGDASGRSAAAAVASAHGLHFVEDAAHAFGSEVVHDGRTRPVGGTGNPVCFSFDPIKSLTCGQGGAVTTADPHVADRVRARSNLGLTSPPEGGAQAVTGPGHRFAMSDLNAAIGLAQLQGFDRRAERRRAIVSRYADGLAEVPAVAVPAHDPDHMVPFMFAVRVPASARNEVRQRLAADGIETGMHYPPGHLQPLYASGTRLPVTERVCDELITLPLTVAMADADVDRVVDAVTAAVGRAAGAARGW